MDNKFAYWKANSLWHDMASTYHSFDRYRSTTNSYIEKQTAYGMIWLRHIIGLIHIDKIIGEVLECQHGIILMPEYLSVGWQVSIGEVHILLKSTTPIDNTHAKPIEIPIGYQWGIIPGVFDTATLTIQSFRMIKTRGCKQRFKSDKLYFVHNYLVPGRIRICMQYYYTTAVV